jgi:hydroxymethylbilane synthase
VAGRRALIVGTRGSRLALCQAELVVDTLRARHPQLELTLREVRTEGDRRSRTSLAQIGGQGVFVKELEAALLRGDIDLAVHSLKDVPAAVREGLVLAAFPERADPRDALVAPGGLALAGLASGARIGTGSARRAVQLRALRPDVEPVDIRGNVDTRVRKVDDGAVDAAILAAAGLARLGLLDRASVLFSPDEMMPAVGQGTLAVEARADDAELLELVSTIDHRETRLACEAERAFLARLGGGCRLPFGALAEVDGDSLRARGFISDDAGGRMLRAEVSGALEEHEALGARLAEALLEQGGAAFIAHAGRASAWQEGPIG